MIKYKIICFCCKNPFFVEEGSRKYQLYKKNMKGKFACENCDHKVYLEARKGLMGKLL